jgi:hypothetical protein
MPQVTILLLVMTMLLLVTTMLVRIRLQATIM